LTSLWCYANHERVVKTKAIRLPVTGELTTVEELALARALEECLEAMERGETDLDRLAGRYPEGQAEIRPLLEIAQELRRERGLGVPLSLDFQEELRERLSQHSVA
jgi:hypothetical protein